MKKRLLTIALCSVSAASFGDVSLYGRLAVGLENDQFQNTTIPGANSVQDYASYFGIRGTDPVYGQTSAVWQIEQYFDATSGQAYYNTTGGGLVVPRGGSTGLNTGRVTSEEGVLASGETYLGLQGAWGRVRLGNLSNYMRASMGSVDLYNYANGVNGLSNWSRTVKILPNAIGYDSPTWGGFGFSAVYSFNNSGQPGITSIGSGTTFGGGLNGYYSGGVYSLGLGWVRGPFSIELGSQIFSNVGTYTTGTSGMSMPSGIPNSAQYSNAYANRLEFGYNDPDSLIVGVGIQVADGLGWASWANSGGSFNNYIYNFGFNKAGLNSAEYQTQEVAASVGYHLGPWTPKIGYAYGNNIMYGGSLGSVTVGNANQIPDTGYQQAVAEIDWNITPRTIAFINYGQVWYGSTLQNISYCGVACASAGSTVNGNNQYLANQGTGGIGFTHTF